MSPFLKAGDVALVDFFEAPRALATQVPGDLVIFKENGEWICHRVLSDLGGLCTKGDHALFPEIPQSVWGRVVGIRGKCQWGQDRPVNSQLFLLASKLFSKNQPRFFRWLAVAMMQFGDFLVLRRVRFRVGLFGRRFFQIFRVLVDKNYCSNEGLLKLRDSRYAQKAEVDFYKSIALSGLEKDETIAIQSCLAALDNKKSALVIGCGAGREVFALSKNFDLICGLDSSSPMIRAAEEVKSKWTKLNPAGANLEFFYLSNPDDLLTTSFIKRNPDSNLKFDFIFVARGVLNHLPRREERVGLMKKLSFLLASEGQFLLQIDVAPQIAPQFAPAGSAWAYSSLRSTLSSRLLKARFQSWEAGDSLRSYLGNHNADSTLLFFHEYRSRQEVCSELFAAGLQLRPAQSSSGFWLCHLPSANASSILFKTDVEDAGVR